MKIGKKTKVTKELTRQERNRRNNIKRLTISAIVAFILFICLIVIQSSILNQEEKTTVYQVIHDIPSGTKLTADNVNSYLAVKDVQLSLVPADPITDVNTIIDKFVNRNYKAKDIITIDGLTDTEKLYKDSIENPVEVSFAIDTLASGSAGTIREGDYVNIYGIRKISDESLGGDVYGYDEGLFSVDQIFTFKHVYIAKAFNSSGTRVDTAKSTGMSLLETVTDVPTTMFSVILDESDVELFNTMLKNCDIRLAKLLYNPDNDYQDFVDETNQSAANVNTGNAYTPNNTQQNNEVQEDTQGNNNADAGVPWYEQVTFGINEDLTTGPVNNTEEEVIETEDIEIEIGDESEDDFSGDIEIGGDDFTIEIGE